MNTKRRITVEIIICILFLCFLVLTCSTAFTDITVFYVSLGLTVCVMIVFGVRIAGIKSRLYGLIYKTNPGITAEQQSVLRTIKIPVLITDSGNKVYWYNEEFKKTMLTDGDILLENIKYTINDFDPKKCCNENGSELEIGKKHYLAISSSTQKGDDSLYVSYFFDDTEKNNDSVEYHKSRPSVVIFYIDNYDELEVEKTEGDQAELLASINRSLEDFINKTNGVLFKVSSKSYIAIIEERHMEKIIDSRFSILDTVRSLGEDTMPLTLSIGVGREAKTMYENYLLARQALDMALGRGGDQAAMKSRNGFVFYGGTSRTIERRSKVKARMIASALTDLFKNCSNVLVMGHKRADLDSVGSAVGIARAAKICGAKVKVLYNAKDSMAQLLYESIAKEETELFIEQSDALGYLDKQSVIVVVDCNSPSLLDDSKLLDITQNIVVIDHHRRMVDYIEAATLSFQEPYTSSCSEMVAEILQHIVTSTEKPTKTEAEAMLAGIMLDTKNYTVRTGIRTFDNASYLRRLGADPTQAKKLFSTSYEEYCEKSRLVSLAKFYRKCAVAVSDTLTEGTAVAVPQAADDLLNIEGISASVVAVKNKDKYSISARSYGDVNVQLIMEQLGGGGHQTMAGASIFAETPEEVIKAVYSAIDTYFENNKQIGG